MSRDSRRHSLIEIAGVTILVAALAVLLYRDFARDTAVPATLPAAAAVEDAPREVPAETKDDPRKVFDVIYARGTWAKDKDGRGTSGPGSTLEFTKLYRVFLQDFLATHGIRSVVDAGCGDWEFSQAIDWSGIDYLGLDIVAPVIEANRRRFGAARIRFAVADIVRDKLPPADLLLVKDVLQHLSHEDITRVLAQLPRYRHVLIVNDVRPGSLTAEPMDIPTGGYRPLDMTQPPHALPGAKVLIWSHGGVTKLVLHLQPRDDDATAGTRPPKRK